jgi:hypothetical protein
MTKTDEPEGRTVSLVVNEELKPVKAKPCKGSYNSAYIGFLSKVFIIS